VNEVLELVHSLRNLLQPVNRLPQEILSRIAQHIPDANTMDTESIIPMTHVCQYWRKSIISTPRNWTLISSGSFGLTKLCLERCKAAPLRIWLDALDLRRNSRFFHLISPYIKNADTLYIHHIPAVGELERTLQNFPRSMTNLRSLTLSSSMRANWDWFKDPRKPPTSPLTHLSLTGIPLYPSFLRLRTLTVLTLHNLWFNLHFDTLLDFLEANCSLECATLHIHFHHPSLRNSHRHVAIKNRLRNLSIYDTMDDNSLISKIAVQKGAHLEVTLYNQNAGLNDVYSLISMPHLLNLHSPTFMEYCPDKRSIRLLGPNGSFSFLSPLCTMGPFVEFPLLPLDNIRTFHLIRPALERQELHTRPFVLPPLSLPALETVSIECEHRISYLLSCFFSNPSSHPSLKTLAFLDCDLDHIFMEKLAQFSSKRKNTTSAQLHRIVILNSKGIFPSLASIGKHVPVVEARVGKTLPPDLK
jgi:hypothetical protein